MNKIIEVYNILKNRLPKKYLIPIRIFKDTKTLLKYQAKINNRSYKSIVKHYDDYLNNPKKATYTKTKYWISRTLTNALDITGLGGNPILLSKNKLNRRPRREIAFLIMHEIGHNLGYRDERKADMFAIRWVKKLIKEKEIK